MDWAVIARNELRVNARHFYPRLKAHPFMTGFFIFIAFGAIFIGIRIVHIIALNPHVFAFDMPRYVWPLMLLFGVAARMGVYAYRKLLKEHELVMLFATSIHPRAILLAKFLSTLLSIYLLLFLAFAMVVFSLSAYGLEVLFSAGFLLEGSILVAIGGCVGMTVPILLQLQPLRDRYAALASYAAILTALGLVSMTATIRSAVYLAALGGFLVVFLLVFFATAPLLQTAWDRERTKPLRHIVRRATDRLRPSYRGKFFDHKRYIVLRKELLVSLRERDALGSIAFAGTLLIVQFSLFGLFGDEPGLFGTYSLYFYPSMLAMTLFLALLPQTALIGAAMLSEEGRELWILQSLPLDGVTILQGKSMALLVFSTPSAYLLVAVLARLAAFPAWLTLFFVIEVPVLIIAYIAIGTWSATRFPNFDPSMRGMPDLMTQYNIIGVCVIASVVLMGIPAFLLRIDPLVGVVAALDALGWAVVLYLVNLDRGAERYDRLEIDVYG